MVENKVGAWQMVLRTNRIHQQIKYSNTEAQLRYYEQAKNF